MRLVTRPGIRAAHAAANGPPAETPTSAAGPAPSPSRTSAASWTPVRDRAQVTGIGSADAGAIGDRHEKSQLARRRREQARRQPRIGQPVAEQNRRPARRASHLDRDHAAVAPAHLHPRMISRSGRSLPARWRRRRTCPPRQAHGDADAVPSPGRRQKRAQSQASPRLTQIIGKALVAITIAAAIMAAAALLAGQGWWAGPAVASAVASLILLGLYLHPMLTLGIAVDAFIPSAIMVGWPALSYIS